MNSTAYRVRLDSLPSRATRAMEHMSDRDPTGIDAKVLTVSDGVIHGTREDKSGVAVDECLTRHGFTVVDRRVVADGVESVADALRSMAAGFAGVIVPSSGLLAVA